MSLLAAFVFTLAPAGGHHPMPQQCANACAVLPASARLDLTDEELRAAARTVARIDPELLRGPSPQVLQLAADERAAIDQLLFYSSSTRSFLDRERPRWLSGPQLAFLRRELSYVRARVGLRVRSLDGRILAEAAPRTLDYGPGQKLQLTSDRTRLVASGTVLRVSTYAVWSRF